MQQCRACALQVGDDKDMLEIDVDNFGMLPEQILGAQSHHRGIEKAFVNDRTPRGTQTRFLIDRLDKHAKRLEKPFIAFRNLSVAE